MLIVNLEAFESTEFNEIFLGRQQLSALRDAVFFPSQCLYVPHVIMTINTD